MNIVTIICDCGTRQVKVADCRLVGGEWTPSGIGHEVTFLEDDSVENLTGVDARKRHTLTCRICGRRVSLRHERLLVILERLVAGGLTRITIRKLQQLPSDLGTSTQ